MNEVISHKHKVMVSDAFLMCLTTTLERTSLPDQVNRIAVNFRNLEYVNTRTGPRPVEVRLKRDAVDKPWQIATLTTFAFTSDCSNELEIELYFNFSQGIFYQPDIRSCDIHQPQVAELLKVWDNAFIQAIKTKSYHYIVLTILETD